MHNETYEFDLPGRLPGRSFVMECLNPLLSGFVGV